MRNKMVSRHQSTLHLKHAQIQLNDATLNTEQLQRVPWILLVLRRDALSSLVEMCGYKVFLNRHVGKERGSKTLDIKMGIHRDRLS
jgi:hypothetical protein